MNWPKYKSHKVVRATKIKSISKSDKAGMRIVTPEDPGIRPFKLTAVFCAKHQPQEGGYIVSYSDDYMSWSPAEAFENGYTRIDEG